mgnify:CR=1 FL=1
MMMEACLRKGRQRAGEGQEEGQEEEGVPGKVGRQASRATPACSKTRTLALPQRWVAGLTKVGCRNYLLALLFDLAMALVWALVHVHVQVQVQVQVQVLVLVLVLALALALVTANLMFAS